MTKRQFVNTKGDTWEWEETSETREAIKKLQIDIDERIRQLEKDAPDYGVGKWNLLHLMNIKKPGEEFFPKYFYVAKELGEGVKAEEILKVMESLAGVVVKKRVEDKLAPFGFNKEKKDAESQSPFEDMQKLDDMYEELLWHPDDELQFTYDGEKLTIISL